MSSNLAAPTKLLTLLRIFILASFAVLGGCGDCDATIQSAKSPNGKYVASVDIINNCGGATVVPYTNVAIDGIPDPLNDYGNVWRVRGIRPVSVRWLSDNELLVEPSVGPTDYIAKERKELGPIAIRFVGSDKR